MSVAINGACAASATELGEQAMIAAAIMSALVRIMRNSRARLCVLIFQHYGAKEEREHRADPVVRFARFVRFLSCIYCIRDYQVVRTAEWSYDSITEMGAAVGAAAARDHCRVQPAHGSRVRAAEHRILRSVAAAARWLVRPSR